MGSEKRNKTDVSIKQSFVQRCLTGFKYNPGFAAIN
jgi:hypothetical protein